MKEFQPFVITPADEEFLAHKEIFDKAVADYQKRLFESFCIPQHLLEGPISLRPDPAAFTNTASASTTEAVTFETISRAIQEFEMISPAERLPPECIVMTDQCYLALQEDCEKKAGHFGMNGAEFGALSHIYGIPIEHYPTEAACVCRAAELFSQHKLRVALVTHQE